MSFYKKKHIRFRIIIPFVMLFAVTSILTWGCYAYIITRYIDGNLQKQMNQLIEVISGSGYTLNPNILNKLKNIVSAEIVIFDNQGNIIQSTIDVQSATHIFKENNMKDVIFNKLKYRAISRSLVLPGYGESHISLLMSGEEISRIKTKLILIMGLVSFLGLFAMGVIGYFIARSITSPVESFADAIKKIDSGESSKRVEVNARDEIGLLADAFNNMIDRVKESEKKLVESEKMATAGQMAAGFAHEIKNPLTGIKMMAQILHRRLKGQDENQEVLTSFVKEINRLDHIINEIINRARPAELNRSWGNINSGITEVLALVEEGYSDEGIEIKLDFSDNLPELFLDHDKIKQVIWNLILNSREAMTSGGILVISTRLRNKNEIEVNVSDTGMGIKDENMNMIFKPFFTSKPEGVGLGLTTSRKIVEKHGGELILRNRQEGGVEAVFHLPVKGFESSNIRV